MMANVKEYKPQLTRQGIGISLPMMQYNYVKR